MKTFKDLLLEKNNNLRDLYLETSDLNKLEAILNGQQTTCYHGTNRDFDKFDITFLRDWRADEFLGKGIFLTPNHEVALKYAEANANSDLPITILEVAKKKDKKLGEFMSSLYYKGNITWELPEFRWMIDNWNFTVDPNDVCELVNLIPNSQSEKDYNKDRDENNYFVNFFSTTSKALEDWQIKNLKLLGLGDYNPKVLTVQINSTKSVLLSSDVDKIKNSNYDITIAYDTPDLIDNIPEVIVKNINLLFILKKEIISYTNEKRGFLPPSRVKPKNKPKFLI